MSGSGILQDVIDQCAHLLCPSDEQADVFTKVIQPAEQQEGFTFVYPVLFDNWDATQHFTSKGGEHRGDSLYQVIQQSIKQSANAKR